MSYNRSDLEEMLKTGQVIRTEKLLTILQQYGFLTRRSGGGSSHIFFWHPEHPDILADTIVAETDNPFYQRLVINACLKSIDLHDTARENVMEPVTGLPREGDGGYVLPSHFEIVHGYKRRTMYLRHKQYPQMATELGSYKNGQDVSEWCDYLDARADKFDSLLHRAVTEYDFERTNYPNGSIVLMHPAHGVNKILHAFSPRIENFRSISVVEDAIAEVQLGHEAWIKHLEGTIRYYGAKEATADHGKERSFVLSSVLSGGKTDIVKLPVTKNGFFSVPDYMRLLYKMEAFDWRDIQKNLKNMTGIHLEKKSDGMLHGSHPIFDIKFSVEDFRKSTPPEERLREYDNLPPDKRQEFLNTLWDELMCQHQARHKINEKLADLLTMRDSHMSEYELLTMGFREVFSKPYRPFGEIQTALLKDKNNKDVMTIRGIRLINVVNAHAMLDAAPSMMVNSWYFVPLQEDIARLRRAMSAGSDITGAFSHASAKTTLLPGLPSSSVKAQPAISVTPIKAWEPPSFRK